MMEFELHPEAQLLVDGQKYKKKDIDVMVTYLKSIFWEKQINGPVGIMLSRSKWLLPAIFACLQNKTPYVLISSESPKHRVQAIVDDCGIELYITEIKFSTIKPNVDTVFFVDKLSNDIENPAIRKSLEPSSVSDIAYIMYTSGSSGIPKGVEVYRSALHNLQAGVIEKIDLKKTARIACITDSTFDIFYLESVMALMIGMHVYMANEDITSQPRILGKWLIENHINVIQLTPSRLQQLLYEDKDLKCIRDINTLMIGGENLPGSLLRALQMKTSAKIYNMYGPTETTVWSSISDLTHSSTVDIGYPIRNTKFYILDNMQNEVEASAPGEICISGDGVARGYLRQAELTNERFIHYNGERAYRTGDFGRMNVDGSFSFISRMDNQVKINGKRVELGEIENAICQFEGIINSVVILTEFLEVKVACVFYISEKELNTDDLKEYLSGLLPKYMIPENYIHLDVYPQTKNGKIDREKLKEYAQKSLSMIDSSLKNDSTISILDTIASVSPYVGKIRPSHKLKEVGFESLTVVKLYTLLEEVYGFRFENDKLVIGSFESIAGLIDYVESRKTKWLVN